MVEIFGANGFGPIGSYVATARTSISGRRINVSSARKNGLLVQAVASQPTDSSQPAQSVALSKDYLVVATQDVAGVKFFSRSGSTFTAQSVPSNFDATNGCCAISADGSTVAAISNLSGGAGAIWHNGSGTLTSLSIGAAVGRGGACAVSSNGAYVAFMLTVSPYLVVKTRSGSGSTATYASMTIADLPTAGSASGFAGGAVAFSPNDTYLACIIRGSATTPLIYKFNAGTGVYEQLTSPFSGSLPDDARSGCSFSPQGDVLAIAELGASNETYIYSRTGDAFTHEATITGGNQGAFSPDGNYYLCGGGQIYKKNSVSSWTLQTTITGVNGAAWSPSVL